MFTGYTLAYLAEILNGIDTGMAVYMSRMLKLCLFLLMASPLVLITCF